MTKLRFIPHKNATTLFPSRFILLLPSVTIGNVPQLAVDLLLSTYAHKPLGHLRSPSVLPFAASLSSSSTDDDGLLMTAVELYLTDDIATELPMVVLQVRAPYARGRAGEFAKEITTWAREVGCEGCVLLVSANAAGRRDGQLGITQENGSHGVISDDRSGSNSLVRVLWTVAGKEWEIGKKVERMGIKVVEGGGEKGWGGNKNEDPIKIAEGYGVRPGWLPMDRDGNFVRVVLEEAEKVGWSVVGLLSFVSEGDNTGDALVLAEVARNSLGLANEAWIWPVTWRSEKPPPVGLY